MKSNKVKQTLKNSFGECSYLYDENQVTIDFTNENNNAAELAVFYNLSQAYLSAAMLLFNDTKKYIKRQEQADRKKRIFLYVPAFFCFRHYIELQLKYFYMRQTGKQFDNCHTLDDLLKALKSENNLNLEPVYPYFEEAVKFIQQHEMYDSQYRYLTTTKFDFDQKLVVKLSDIEQIKQIALQLNQSLGMYFVNELLQKLSSN